MRLFVAVPIPAAQRMALSDAAAALRDGSPRARWERAEKLHLTLAFLGEVAGEQLGGLVDALRDAAGQEAALDLRLGAPGAFPSAARARVLWVGVEDGERLTGLQRRVAGACAPYAESRETKPFHAHLTLARCDPPWPAPQVERFAAHLRGVASGPFPAREVVLVESELGRGGSRYRDVERLELTGAGG
jgi:2'-5' RNA ligase